MLQKKKNHFQPQKTRGKNFPFKIKKLIKKKEKLVLTDFQKKNFFKPINGLINRN